MYTELELKILFNKIGNKLDGLGSEINFSSHKNTFDGISYPGFDVDFKTESAISNFIDKKWLEAGEDLGGSESTFRLKEKGAAILEQMEEDIEELQYNFAFLFLWKNKDDKGELKCDFNSAKINDKRVPVLNFDEFKRVVREMREQQIISKAVDLSSTKTLYRTGVRASEFRKHLKKEDRKDIVKVAQPKKVDNLISEDNFVYHGNKLRIKQSIRELTKLDLNEFPNSAATLIRLIWEFLAHDYIVNNNHLARLKEQQNEHIKQRRSPNLREMMRFLTNESIITDTKLIRAIDLFMNDKNNKPILLELNQFVHNENWTPTPSKLREIWTNLFPILSFLAEGLEVAD